MTFENWWRSKYPADIGEIEFRLLRESFEEATKAEREACAKHLKDAAARIAPEGRRTNQYDRHVACVLNDKAAELLMRSNVKVRG